jgi:hypothetical protein
MGRGELDGPRNIEELLFIETTTVPDSSHLLPKWRIRGEERSKAPPMIQ